jgi:hypothetical protein
VLWEFVSAFKPPRAIELDFPLGATLGRPNDAEMQRNVLRAGLAAAPLFGAPWRSLLLPASWSGDDRSWEDATRDLYRNDDGDDGTMAAHQADHQRRGEVLAGHEAEFVSRHLV